MNLKLEHPNILKGFLFAFLGTALFSFKSIFIKLAYAQGLDTNSVLMLRMAISLPIYLTILVYLFRKKGSKKDRVKENFLMILFLGFIGYFLASWLDLKGLESISASLERLTLFTYPIFVAILGALFFKIPLDKKIIFTLILTYFGLWIVFSQEMKSGVDIGMGVMFVLLSAFSYALYVLLSKKVIHSVGSLLFTSLAMSVSSGFVLFYYGIFFDFDMIKITTQAWIWVFLLSVVSTVVPSFMISEAIAKIGAAKTGIVGTLGPIITILLAIVILDEIFTIYHAIGILFVFLGVLLLTFKR